MRGFRAIPPFDKQGDVVRRSDPDNAAPEGKEVEENPEAVQLFHASPAPHRTV